jgi:hypothetical protein
VVIFSCNLHERVIDLCPPDFSGQLNEEKAEQWCSIGNMIGESKHITCEFGHGGPLKKFGESTLDYGQEVLAKVDEAEHVCALGVDQALLAPRK